MSPKSGTPLPSSSLLSCLLACLLDYLLALVLACELDLNLCGRVWTSPIAHSRSRGRSTQQDCALIDEIAAAQSTLFATTTDLFPLDVSMKIEEQKLTVYAPTRLPSAVVCMPGGLTGLVSA